MALLVLVCGTFPLQPAQLLQGLSYVLAHPGGSVMDYLQDEEFHRAVGRSAAAGAVGGITGFVLPFGTGILAAAGKGLLTGAVSGVAEQFVRNQYDPCADWYDHLLEAGIVGGVAGALTGGIFRGIGQATGRLSQQAGNAAREVANKIHPPKPLIRAVQKLQNVYRDSGIPMISVIYDERTGAIYDGIAGKYGSQPTQIHKIIQNRINKGFEFIDGVPQSKTPWPNILNCAECRALNKALNNGAREVDLHIYTWRPRSFNPSTIPEVWARCSNCQITVSGARTKIWSELSPWNNIQQILNYVFD